MSTSYYNQQRNRSPSLSSNSGESSVSSAPPVTPAMDSEQFDGAHANKEEHAAPFSNTSNTQSGLDRKRTTSLWSAGHKTGAGTASFDSARARFASQRNEAPSPTANTPQRFSSIRSNHSIAQASPQSSWQSRATSNGSHASLPPLATNRSTSPVQRSHDTPTTPNPTLNSLNTPAHQLNSPSRSPYLAGAFSSPVAASSPTFASSAYARPPSPLREQQSAASPNNRALSSALFASRADPASPNGSLNNTPVRTGSFALGHKRAMTLPQLGAQGLPVSPDVASVVEGGGEVVGLNGRVRLSRPAEAPSPFAPSAVFSSSHGLSRQAQSPQAGQASPSRLGGSFLPSQTVKAMERQRKDLVAYEYLCHVAETRNWLEDHITTRSETSPPLWDENVGVSGFEQTLRSGYALAHLARSLGGEDFGARVRRIYSDPVRCYHHVDNINIFLDFVQAVGLPEIFRFETVDLFDAKNLPKVTYCVHALALLLARRGITGGMDDLRGQVEFSDEELERMQKGLDSSGVRMPNFGGLSKAMDRQVETPEERAAREQAAREAREEQERLEREAAEAAERQRFGEEKRQREEERRAERARQEAEREVQRRRDEAEAEALRQRQEAERRRQEAEREAERQRQAQIAAEKEAELEWRRQTARDLVGLRAQARGVLVRRRFFDTLDALDADNDSVTALQAHLRGVLARRQLLNHIRSMRSSEEPLVGFQAHLRGVLARRAHQFKIQHLRHATTVRGVSNLQSLARAALVRQRVGVQRQELGFVEPDVTALQAQIRGWIVRGYFLDWQQNLRDNIHEVVRFQALVRGQLARRRLEAKKQFLREHLRGTIQLQAAVRARKQGTQYRQLRMGKSVPVSTVRNFARLLDDSEFDYRGELQVEALRRELVSMVREVQDKEDDVKDLDIKIALLVKNQITHEAARAARHTTGKLGANDRNHILSAHSDPFAGNSLDKQAQHKLELYQQLFLDLQTNPNYLARLFASGSRLGLSDKAQRTLEGTTFVLFGYAQNQREEFLLLKLFQKSIQEEVHTLDRPDLFAKANMIWVRLFSQYGRGAAHRDFLAEVLGQRIDDLLSRAGVDLRADPVKIYQAQRQAEEDRTGHPSPRPANVSHADALQDPEVRALFGKRLLGLHKAAEAVLISLFNSLNLMPFGVRYVGREVYRALRTAFPETPERDVIRAVANLIYYRYVQPALVAPDSFGIVPGVVVPNQRQNLSEVAKLLNQISVGRLFATSLADAGDHAGAEAEAHLVPMNSFIAKASEQFALWTTDLINVPDAEAHFRSDEYADAAASHRPVVYISPNDIYSIHTIINQQIDVIAPAHDDPIRAVLAELGGVPLSSSDEDLATARATEVALTLTNRHRPAQDPDAPRKALFNQAKRQVLAILKIHSGADLEAILATPVTDNDEQSWAELAQAELDEERRAAHAQRRPLVRLKDDVRQLSFAELKRRTVLDIIELRKTGLVSKADKYQALLDSIASDIRSKHHRRVQRNNELSNMTSTLTSLRTKRDYLQGTISSYHAYIDTSMQNVHKPNERKRWSMPWSLQAAHQRKLDKKDKKYRHGSFVYTAKALYERKEVLLSIKQYSPTQFEDIKVIFSCDVAGVYEIEIVPDHGENTVEQVKLADLLEMQFAGERTLSISDVAKFHLDNLVHLINKKFSV